MSFSNRMSAALYPPVGAVPNTVRDYAGNNNGTNNGAKVALVDGRSGLEFDASQQTFVQAESAISGYPFTLEAQCIITDDGEDRAIIQLDFSGDTQTYIGIQNRSSGQMQMWARSGSSSFNVRNAPSINPDPGQWIRVSAVFSSPSDRALYVNGELFADDDREFVFDTRIDTALIGLLRLSSPTWYWDGEISDARIWNIARTQSEIQADMHKRLTGNEPGLVGYWPMAYNAHR